MTIEQLREIIARQAQLKNALVSAVNELDAFIERGANAVSPDNEISESLNVDSLAARQIPVYARHLTNIAAALAALQSQE